MAQQSAVGPRKGGIDTGGMPMQPGQQYQAQAAFDKSMFDHYRNVSQLQASSPNTAAAHGNAMVKNPDGSFSHAGAGWDPVGQAPGQPVTPQTPAPEGLTQGGLGLGLGLNQAQRERFQTAAQAGQGAQYLGEHRGLARRVENRVEAGSGQEQRLQNFLGTGQSQRPYQQNQQQLLEATKRRR